MVHSPNDDIKRTIFHGVQQRALWPARCSTTAEYNKIPLLNGILILFTYPQSIFLKYILSLRPKSPVTFQPVSDKILKFLDKFYSKIRALWECYAVSLGMQFPTFRRIILPSPSQSSSLRTTAAREDRVHYKVMSARVAQG